MGTSLSGANPVRRLQATQGGGMKPPIIPGVHNMGTGSVGSGGSQPSSPFGGMGMLAPGAAPGAMDVGPMAGSALPASGGTALPPATGTPNFPSLVGGGGGSPAGIMRPQGGYDKNKPGGIDISNLYDPNAPIVAGTTVGGSVPRSGIDEARPYRNNAGPYNINENFQSTQVPGQGNPARVGTNTIQGGNAPGGGQQATMGPRPLATASNGMDVGSGPRRTDMGSYRGAAVSNRGNDYAGPMTQGGSAMMAPGFTGGVDSTPNPQSQAAGQGYWGGQGLDASQGPAYAGNDAFAGIGMTSSAVPPAQSQPATPTGGGLNDQQMERWNSLYNPAQATFGNQGAGGTMSTYLGGHTAGNQAEAYAGNAAAWQPPPPPDQGQRPPQPPPYQDPWAAGSEGYTPVQPNVTLPGQGQSVGNFTAGLNAGANPTSLGMFNQNPAARQWAQSQGLPLSPQTMNQWNQIQAQTGRNVAQGATNTWGDPGQITGIADAIRNLSIGGINTGTQGTEAQRAAAAAQGGIGRGGGGGGQGGGGGGQGVRRDEQGRPVGAAAGQAWVQGQGGQAPAGQAWNPGRNPILGTQGEDFDESWDRAFGENRSQSQGLSSSFGQQGSVSGSESDSSSGSSSQSLPIWTFDPSQASSYLNPASEVGRLADPVSPEMEQGQINQRMADIAQQARTLQDQTLNRLGGQGFDPTSRAGANMMQDILRNRFAEQNRVTTDMQLGNAQQRRGYGLQAQQQADVGNADRALQQQGLTASIINSLLGQRSQSSLAESLARSRSEAESAGTQGSMSEQLAQALGQNQSEGGSRGYGWRDFRTV